MKTDAYSYHKNNLISDEDFTAPPHQKLTKLLTRQFFIFN